LNTLLDRDLSTDFTVELEVAFSEIDSPEAIRETAMKENASYRTAVESLNQARISRNITRSAYVPELSLSASYGYDRIADELDFSLNDPTRNWDVRATLSLNIFNGFRRRIDSNNAALRVRNGELLEKQANLELESELANAHESYRNSLTVLRLEERNIESARVNFKRTSELYNLGQVTSTQFREAQLNLIKAETNVSTATFDAKLDEIELLRITGNLISEMAPAGNRRGDNY
jgi:outer membrane protein